MTVVVTPAPDHPSVKEKFESMTLATPVVVLIETNFGGCALEPVLARVKP